MLHILQNQKTKSNKNWAKTKHFLQTKENENCQSY